MNFSLKPHPLIAHWVPGMVVLVALVSAHFHWDYGNFTATCAKDASVVSVTILLFSVLAFLIGELLDSVRDLLENILDKKWPVNWDYLLTAGGEEADRFNDCYFTYYVLNANLGFALVSFLRN